MLRSFADLGKLAIPDPVLVELARIYAAGLDEIQRQLVSLFTVVEECGWNPAAVESFRSTFSAEMNRFARNVRVIADYTQQRNLQRAVLQKIDQHGTATGSTA